MTLDLVTGAFGYTGSRVAERLLAAGREVRTMTRRGPSGHPLEPRVTRATYDFQPAGLAAALAGVDTVYVTYWMRYPRGDVTWAQMVDNVARLAAAAATSGVRRLIFFSVTNARHDSSTAYFRAKAAAEDAVLAAASGGSISVAIIRPTLLYGPGDILINNMAWTLRRLPVFGVPGDGRYRVQPVHVDDVADLALNLGRGDEAVDVDAAGPETMAFDDLVRTVREAVGSRALVTHMPATLVLATTRLLGVMVRDEMLTRDEIRELSESLLVARDAAGTCPTRFSDWVRANGELVGREYSSEMARNFRFEQN